MRGGAGESAAVSYVAMAALKGGVITVDSAKLTATAA